ncbi:5-oxoprolinase subunit PxpA [Glaciecola siphonariae]|uniref:5-oxoprolinase subunit PxpA n=1 Tax=Glaciecola siphonariae TaxID=521012 RepID=A0ABV9LTC9_9ALTE
MKLNADLGESFGRWQSTTDADVMPYIDQANVACGYHAGDPKVLAHTIGLVKQYGVSLGAHPSYPDLQGFGRRSMRMPADELIPLIHAQIAIVEGMAKCQHLALDYVKPHGALYNDMMLYPQVYEDVVTAISQYHAPLPLMIQALANNDFHIELAKKQGVTLLFEAFADRRYTANGYLMARTNEGAVLDADHALAQAKALIDDGCVIADDGKRIALRADTLCVHGDTPSALSMLTQIRDYLDSR